MCPSFGVPGSDEARHAAYHTTHDQTLCESTCITSGCVGTSCCGRYEVAEMPDSDDHYVEWRWGRYIQHMSLVLAGIAAAITLRSVHNGGREHLAPFVRAVLILVICELATEVLISQRFVSAWIGGPCSADPWPEYNPRAIRGDDA